MPDYFCTFVGYPKSGHSLTGSLLDAHPNIIIAHELNVLKCLHMGMNRETIYSLILQNSEYYAKKARTWSGYSYLVPGQWNGKYETLNVIGDKKGGGTSYMLSQHPELLDKLKGTFPLIHKFIHVTRNPFDSITTLSLTVKKEIMKIFPQFVSAWHTVSELKKKIPPEDWLDIRHEEFIATPAMWLTRLCNFLGQDIPGGYLDACAAMVNPEPHRSRSKTTWSTQNIAAVEKKMKPYPFLDGYSFLT